jgi:carbon-monoxide dehydrogenase large subunit
METRGAVMALDPFSGGLTAWCSTQAPHLMRGALVQATGLPENQIRVIAPEVGGGFGAKVGLYPEDALLATVVTDLKRPAKWVETRSENLQSMSHGRAQIADLEVACPVTAPSPGCGWTCWPTWAPTQSVRSSRR